jgi:hypothetical protein
MKHQYSAIGDGDLSDCRLNTKALKKICWIFDEESERRWYMVIPGIFDRTG